MAPKLPLHFFFIADVWNRFVEILSAQVKVPCLIGLLLPYVASGNSYKGHYFSQLEVLMVTQLTNCLHKSAVVYTGVEKNWVHLHMRSTIISIIYYERLFMIGWNQRV